MKFKRLFSSIAILSIAAVPVATVISCGSKTPALNMSGSLVSKKDNDNPFEINNMPFEDGYTLFNQSQLDTLRSNLKKNLYYGPEAWDLKSITLDTGHITSGSQLGVYYPSAKQIFINISDLEGVPINAAYDEIEKVIAHEYGHHFFATYANGYKKENDSAVKNENGYVYDNDGNDRYVEPWNKDYFDAFVSEYNMFDTTGSGLDKNKGGQASINRIFSLKDLFDNANHSGSKLDWGITDKVTFGSQKTPVGMNLTPASYAVAVDKENESTLKYIYSMDEQVVRKMQMMFYPGKIETSKFGFDASLLKVTSGKSNFFDPYAVDWMRSADLYSDGRTIHKAAIYPDDIFENNKVNEAYKAITDLMGYGKQISHMYSKNDVLVSSKNRTTGFNSSNNNLVRITGYVDPSKKFTKIVTKSGELVTNINVSKTFGERFHFFHKSTWNSSVADQGPSDETKYPYSTEYFRVKNFNGEKLYFSDKNGIQTPITEINQTKDGDTNVNSYDSQRPDGNTYYKLTEKDGTAIVGGY